MESGTRHGTPETLADMDIPTLWPGLDAQTRDWLVEHNGEPLVPVILDALIEANGGSLDAAWLAEDDGDGPVLIDEAIDWIEAVANGEAASGT